MHFVKLLNIFAGVEAIPAALRAEMDRNPSLALAIKGGQALAANPTAINWQALIALVMQLLPVILPLLGG